MKRPIYADHNATTPLDPRVLEAMLSVMGADHGNASSIHGPGRRSRKAVDEARDEIARILGVRSREVVFTAGGTEANNLALQGLAMGAAEGRRRRIVTTAVEHSSVLEVARSLEARGWAVTFVPPEPDGTVSPVRVAEALGEDVLLLSVTRVNNETGAIMDVASMASAAHERGILVHTDAVQAPGKAGFRPGDLGVDLLSLGAHKFHGPHGAGLLFVRRGVSLAPLLAGADHERGRRPGTLNHPAIVGMARALSLVDEEGEGDAERLRCLSGRLLQGLRERVPGMWLNGPEERRAPGTVNVGFQDVDGEALLLALDMEGIFASSGSACHSGSLDPSHVLLAMGQDQARAVSSLRLSLGRGNREEDVERLLEVVPRLVEDQRRHGGASQVA